MNLNYVGSVAERFMKFRSSLATTEDVSEDIFNAISIYVPKSLASANLASGSFDADSITATKYAVIAVTADNYTSVLADTGALISQWKPIFNDGANVAVTLYIVVFDDTDFEVTVGQASIAWAPLTKAFNELYFISFFKTMFATTYNTADYIDMALCLSYLCENESTLSFCLTELYVTVPETASADANDCKVMSLTRGEETTHCTTLTGSTQADRVKYFWGFLLLLGFNHTELHIHNGTFMIPVILAKWFEETNDSGEYVGNKLAKIRLSGSAVKPTGLPSPLDSDVNLNLDSSIYEVLDAKYVGYFISISASTANNAELIRDRNGQNFPITAYMIAKYIDYQTSQDLANFRDSADTLTNPILVNEETYMTIQSLLASNIQKFTGTKRITDIVLNFPPFSEAVSGQSITGVAVWSATYVDDLGSVTITGTINF